jgi:hypothetical protein
MAPDANDQPDGGESVTVERLPPDEAFGLLGHEIRFAILEALNDADGELPFSELRERVGVRDTGQFNYHLGELVGRFVRRTDDGYRLAAAGRRVVGAVLSGGVTQAMDADPVATDAECLECGGTMEARFREDGIAVECADCGMQYTDPDVPPGVVERQPPEAVARVVERWNRREQASAGYGFCQYCDGGVDVTVCLPGEAAAPDWFTEEVREGDGIEADVVYECGRCGASWHALLELAALTHPAVMGFHYEHGIDLRGTPSWELPWMGYDVATVTGEDPLRVDLPVELDDERAVFTFDRDLSVVEERREPVPE